MEIPEASDHSEQITEPSQTRRRRRLGKLIREQLVRSSEIECKMYETRHEAIREKYWQLRNAGKRADAEQYLVSVYTHVSDVIAYGTPVLLNADVARGPRMDARGKNFSGLSDIALSIAVFDRTYGFYSDEDLSNEDRARIGDISGLTDDARRAAIREFLNFSSSDATEEQLL